MGKKKRGQQDEPVEPSGFDRLFENRSLRIVVGAAVLVAFAIAAILVVTVLGGDALSTSDGRIKPPAAIGPAPQLERSAAADILGAKSWDDMSEGERALVQSEVNRVFNEATFRATNDLIIGIDIFRQGGLTLVSRQYQQIELPSGKSGLAQVVIFYCEQADTGLQPYRYLLSPLQAESGAIDGARFARPWDRIMADIDWSSVIDLGFEEVNGRRVHGFDVHYVFGDITGAVTPTGTERRTRYWFDVETAQLLQRGQVVPDDSNTEKQAAYTLDYREPPAIVLPDSLEKPACVQEILAKVAA